MTTSRTDMVYGRQGGRIVSGAPSPAPSSWPLCDVCGRPMTAGQSDRHLTCAPEVAS